MRKLIYLDTALDDFDEIFEYIALQSMQMEPAYRCVDQLRARCKKLATLPGTLGRLRSDLRPNLRSLAYKNYVIFFQYIEDRMEIVNVLESHRDIIGYYGDDDDLS